MRSHVAMMLSCVVLLAGCAVETVQSDGGRDIGLTASGSCADEMAALVEARRRCTTLGCTTSLPCGPSFGHCSECFYEYACEMGVVVVRANGVQCDSGARP
jgi:hypothetical protein